MHSRTIIAGSIAIAICLISGSLVYAARQNDRAAKRAVRDQRSEAESQSERDATASEGIIRSCGEEVGVGPETSCELGLQVWRDKQNSGPGSTITVEDPGSGGEVSLDCEGGGASAAIVCTGDSSTVYLAAP